jgi:hypothetical protein
MFSNLLIDSKAEAKCKYPNFDFSTGKIPGVMMHHISTIDDPSYVSYAIFFIGCNLKCSTCCNKPSLSFNTPVVPFNLDVINDVAHMVDGITIVGGDALIQDIRSLKAILLRARELGLRTNVSTNGIRLFDSDIKELYPLIDHVYIHVTEEFIALGLYELLPDLPMDYDTIVIWHPYNQEFVMNAFGLLDGDNFTIKKDFFYGGSKMVPSKI